MNLMTKNLPSFQNSRCCLRCAWDTTNHLNNPVVQFCGFSVHSWSKRCHHVPSTYITSKSSFSVWLLLARIFNNLFTKLPLYQINYESVRAATKLTCIQVCDRLSSEHFCCRNTSHISVLIFPSTVHISEDSYILNKGFHWC